LNIFWIINYAAFLWLFWQLFYVIKFTISKKELWISPTPKLVGRIVVTLIKRDSESEVQPTGDTFENCTIRASVKALDHLRFRLIPLFTTT
jgi:hypothetical protein